MFRVCVLPRSSLTQGASRSRSFWLSDGSVLALRDAPPVERHVGGGRLVTLRPPPRTTHSDDWSSNRHSTTRLPLQILWSALFLSFGTPARGPALRTTISRRVAPFPRPGQGGGTYRDHRSTRGNAVSEADFVSEIKSTLDTARKSLTAGEVLNGVERAVRTPLADVSAGASPQDADVSFTDPTLLSIARALRIRMNDRGLDPRDGSAAPLGDILTCPTGRVPVVVANWQRWRCCGQSVVRTRLG
ncbi:hypothetical protein SAMN05421507_13621 [Lentzea jiangxiensis]|uniref:Uncharacterized protein n=1 Tax=Lentzea jiangxiensis TaxID=641025 RepID=A0A1H0X5K7_9PSEU|nr:hypothetical protein SAMN05421507_13621 [Lentzea jiangxiensis]